MKSTHKSKLFCRGIYAGLKIRLSLFLVMVIFLPIAPAGATVVWVGSGTNDNWSNGDNWAGGVPPISTDMVEFNSGDSGNTNIVDLNFTIAGLQYIGNSVHTTDFNGSNSLQIDDLVYIGYGDSTNVADITWTNGGAVTIGGPGGLETFYVGVNTSSTSGTTAGYLSLDGLTVNAFVSELSIGRKIGNSLSSIADGSLILGSNSILHVGTADDPAVVNIGMEGYTNIYHGTDGSATGLLDVTQGTADFHLSELNVGRRTPGWAGSKATGTLRWDQPEPLYAEDVYFGRGGYSTGILEVPEDGTFKLGTASDPVSLLAISYQDQSGGGPSQAHLNLRNAGIDPTFEAHIGGDLSIGRTSSGGTSDGILMLGNNSSLYVGTTATPAVVNIGMKSGNGEATGLLDATQGATYLHLSELNVGRNASSEGTATGTLTWNQTNVIDATNVYFGRGASTGNLVVPSGGHFKLGTATDPVSLLAISYNDALGAGTSKAHLDFTGTDPSFEAYIGGELSIGRKASNSLSSIADGSLILGSNSILHVGTADDPAVVNIGMEGYTNIYHGTDGSATGLLDVTQGTADFHLSELNVGRRTPGWAGSKATGTLKTGSGSNITATTVNVGTGKNATGTVTMGSGSVTTATTINVGMGTNTAGTVNMKGGLLAAETVNLGTGGTFNFTGGRLGIGTFNTYGGVGSLEQQGGTLAPGFSRTETSLAGIATINGNFNLYSAGVLEVELFGLTIGFGYDQVVVNGEVNLNADLGNGGILDLVLGFTPEVGNEFIIIDNDDNGLLDPIQGTFAGLPEGATFTETYLGLPFGFKISYVGHTGNDVVITSTGVIPAPGAIILGSIGICVVGWLRRSRTL